MYLYFILIPLFILRNVYAAHQKLNDPNCIQNDLNICHLCRIGWNLKDGTCHATCKSLEFFNLDLNLCQSCQDGCINCINNYSCLLCNTEYELNLSKTCVLKHQTNIIPPGIKDIKPYLSNMQTVTKYNPGDPISSSNKNIPDNSQSNNFNIALIIVFSIIITAIFIMGLIWYIKYRCSCMCDDNEEEIKPVKIDKTNEHQHLNVTNSFNSNITIKLHNNEKKDPHSLEVSHYNHDDTIYKTNSPIYKTKTDAGENAICFSSSDKIGINFKPNEIFKLTYIEHDFDINREEFEAQVGQEREDNDNPFDKIKKLAGISCNYNFSLLRGQTLRAYPETPEKSSKIE